MRQFRLRAIATLALLTATPAHADTIIDNTPGPANLGGISGFPSLNGITFGHTFKPGADTVLDSFSLFIKAAGEPLSLKGYVYAWDGSRAIGPALFASNVRTFDQNGLQEFAFATGALSLTSGQSYVAFLSTLGVQEKGTGFIVPAGDPIDDGDFVYVFPQSSDLAAVTETDWSRSNYETWFRASFSAAPSSPAPEPATWLAMVVGFGLIGMTLRARRHQTVAL